MTLYLKTYRIVALLLFVLLSSFIASAGQKQETGGIKGKVRDENRRELAGVAVTVFQEDKEIASTTSNKNGDFKLKGIAVGTYRVTFNKPGLSLGTLASVKIRAGKITELEDRLILHPDEGTLAFIRGSVFDPNGRSVRGAKVELYRVFSDGSMKRVRESASGIDGQFAFRLSPDAAKYRVTVKLDGAETASKDVVVEGAAIYRVAVSLEPKKN
jgi:hypothetical protein